jgi:outer membrane protein assembly factor BamB
VKSAYRIDAICRDIAVIRTCLLLAVVFTNPVVNAAEFPRGWRGDGSGTFVSQHPPVKWSATQNVLWRTPMPAKSNSQPVIVGNRVFTLVEPNTLICLDRSSGKILWQRTNSYKDLLGDAKWVKVEVQLKRYREQVTVIEKTKRDLAKFRKKLADADPNVPDAIRNLQELIRNYEARIEGRQKEIDQLPLAKKWKTFPTHRGKNGYTTATPVADGKHIWAVFGNAVVCCYDLKGNRRWMKRMKDKPHRMFGHSASPLLVGERLIVNIEDTVALDKTTGQELWRTGWGQGWGSAIRVNAADGTDLVAIANGRFLRLSDGKVVGRGINLSDSSPVVHNGVVYSIQNRGGAMKPGKIVNDNLQLQRLWDTDPPGSRYFSSPVFHEGLLYTMSSQHVFVAIDAKTGKVVYRRRLNVGGGTGYPSVAFAGGFLYASGDNGTTVVIRPGRVYKEVARNKLDGFISTPVFAGDRMYLRTFKSLYCIGRSDRKPSR